LAPERELWIALGVGALLGAMLPRFRPQFATALAALITISVSVFAYWLFVRHRIWFAWCVPVFVQAPLALAFAVAARYFLEERRRRALRWAFGHYLSEKVVDQIADADFDLSPGGVIVEASVMMTDLEGFTSLSEELDDPERLSKILIQYFSETTRHILGTDGTIINFVGDAVTAVWGVPLRQPDHAQKAALAAWRLSGFSRIEVDGQLLRTRIGLHTGKVLAGNIGSAERFDYAVVGDAANFASRLEGLNKYFGTVVLLSEKTRQQLGDSFVTRCLGEIRVKGKRESGVIHELIGPATSVGTLPWAEHFAHGLEAFRCGAWDECERWMRETIALREGGDPPAEFYLVETTKARARGTQPNWTGVIEFTAK
jgi:adenylate cyclase